MKKYNTKPIDFTGCHPVIAEHLKRGEAIKCRVWDNTDLGGRVVFVVGYSASSGYPYRCDNAGNSIYCYAEPIPVKIKRIMPPERAIPVLIAEGWRFTSTGFLTRPDCVLSPKRFALMGEDVDSYADEFAWPPCIIEEVEDE